MENGAKMNKGWRDGDSRRRRSERLKLPVIIKTEVGGNGGKRPYKLLLRLRRICLIPPRVEIAGSILNNGFCFRYCYH